MHIAFTVPMWAMIGFGTIAYPSIGAMIASFLARTSEKRLPRWLVFSSGAAWPVTLGAAIAAFPVWLAIWIVSNYSQAVQATLRGNGKGMPPKLKVTFGYLSNVLLTAPFKGNEAMSHGVVMDVRPGESYVEFNGGSHLWVNNKYLLAA